MRHKTSISFVLLLFAICSYVYAGESVTFKGTSKTGDAFMLKGTIDKPSGQGPFPAIVMLSGANGFIRAGYDRWVERFINWGYVALKVETLPSRGFSTMFEGDAMGASPVVSKQEAAQDAYDAKAYLSGLAFVDRNRIGLSGWGFGGGAVLRAVDPSVRLQNREIPFKVAVAFYPMCDQPLMGFDTPLLVLNGELDTMHPASRCRVIEGRSKHDILMKTYSGAYLFFDLEGTDETESGHKLLYDPAAASDAVEQMKNFLVKYVK